MQMLMKELITPYWRMLSKLTANEFTFNPQLGYISLQQRLGK